MRRFAGQWLASFIAERRLRRRTRGGPRRSAACGRRLLSLSDAEFAIVQLGSGGARHRDTDPLRYDFLRTAARFVSRRAQVRLRLDVEL